MENQISELLPLPYKYGKGYIYLPITLPELPLTIDYDGKTLTLKQSFHASCVCVKEIAPKLAVHKDFSEEEASKELLDLFSEFTSSHPIEFIGFQNDFRYVVKAEKETIVVRCDLSNLKEFFEQCLAPLELNVPVQPSHITLYALMPEVGIGITSEEAMNSYPKIELPEIQSVLFQ